MIKLSVQKFILILTISITFSLISLFAYVHLNQQESTSSIIDKNIHTALSEVNYAISKNITSKEQVSQYRPLLDRIAANNDFIAAIIIHDGKDILLSTDPFFVDIPKSSPLQSNENSIYNQLIKKEAIEENIRFYIGNNITKLHLTFILDKEEIHSIFHKKDLNFLFLFIFIPMSIILLIWITIKKLLINPLELLRQYAYYQNTTPKVFMLREIETIRHSMVETFSRLEKEKKELYEIARTDLLSGLANRNALIEFLERLIPNSQRENKEFAMIFLDLDHFKSINDSIGHNVGDELLKRVAGIIDQVLRSNDFVARVGGDEFVIILQEYNSLRELTTVIDRIQSVLQETIIIQTHPINISSSVGIAFYPKDGEDIVSLMRNSDIAMYEAKKNGRSQYHFYTEELNKRVQDLITIEKNMKEAFKNNEFRLYYQPKVDINTGKIIAAEALIRWISPSKGIISPDSFIPIAEENGFILELGEWIINTAIKQQKLFVEKGIDIGISINLSPKQLLSDNFTQNLIKSIEHNEVNPTSIDVEITENLFYKYNDKNIKILNAIHDKGISISLDDFGTGYSSLSYLKDFPIDYLKIDKSFIDDFNTERGRVFIETIVKMGQTLKMEIIAEGVETFEQLEYLKSIGCDQYQGYYKSKPLCSKDFENFYLN
jgi:diguanylate cyclase (GGDEF)-like protein